jgi:tRNA-binding EMAP/Myf-like protein
MMGLESCGMILSAEHDGKLTVLTTLNDIQSGAEVV